MSSNLVWEPVRRKTTVLDDAVKFALQKRCGSPVDVVLDSRDSSYLEGMRDAGVKGAADLLKAIENHGEIEVKEVF